MTSSDLSSAENNGFTPVEYQIVRNVMSPAAKCGFVVSIGMPDFQFNQLTAGDKQLLEAYRTIAAVPIRVVYEEVPPGLAEQLEAGEVTEVIDYIQRNVTTKRKNDLREKLPENLQIALDELRAENPTRSTEEERRQVDLIMRSQYFHLATVRPVVDHYRNIIDKFALEMTRRGVEYSDQQRQGLAKIIAEQARTDGWLSEEDIKRLAIYPEDENNTAPAETKI